MAPGRSKKGVGAIKKMTQLNGHCILIIFRFVLSVTSISRANTATTLSILKRCLSLSSNSKLAGSTHKRIKETYRSGVKAHIFNNERLNLARTLSSSSVAFNCSFSTISLEISSAFACQKNEQFVGPQHHYVLNMKRSTLDLNTWMSKRCCSLEPMLPALRYQRNAMHMVPIFSNDAESIAYTGLRRSS